ncbi:hypothetical protein DUNSADRAFT_9684, partial [Dunaliella salina]
MLVLARALLMDAGLTKATFRLKEQLAALEMNVQHLRMLHSPAATPAPISESCGTSLPLAGTGFEPACLNSGAPGDDGRDGDESSRKGSSLAAALAANLGVGAPVVDVLLAIWILEPDNALVSEFNSEGRSGKKASSK